MYLIAAVEMVGWATRDRMFLIAAVETIVQAEVTSRASAAGM